ncbi:acid protease [Cytidiella melzeri]|nr:acid protease [Cytidiella melzeri]
MSMARLFLLSSACTLLQLVSSQSIPLLRVPRQQLASPSILSVSNNVSVTDSDGFAYLANMSIGAQDFMVLLDTGSSDLWVVSSDCSETDCRGVPKYQQTPTLNSTSTDFHLNYLLGAVSGSVGTETVSLGPFEILDQVFAMANQTEGLGLSSTGNSGILGLSFPFEASIPDTSGTTLLENLLSPFDDSDRYFAIKLGRDGTNSSFTVGQLDPSVVNSPNDITFTAVPSFSHDIYDYWKMPLQYLTINSTHFPLSTSSVPGASTPIAVFDTGTTLILGPSDDVDRFWMSVKGSRKTDQGWQVRCDRAIAVGFVLGEGDSLKEYVIDPEDLSWMQGGKDGEWCTGGIQANDGVSSGDWLLGDTFLRNVYIVHQVATGSQPPQVGLMGLTDTEGSLTNFRLTRGDDPTGPVSVLTTVTRHGQGLSAVTIYSISGASGFAFGAVLTAGLYLCLGRKRKP